MSVIAKMSAEEVLYNVVCMECGQVWTPLPKSPLWWRAKKAADSGRLDAIQVSGEECGCVEPRNCQDAPFRVFGYNDLCEDFDIPCGTFAEAVKTFRELNSEGYMVFISGVSDAVSSRLEFGD